MNTSRKSAAVALAAAAIALGGLAASPASAATVQPNDWNGNCTASNNATTFHGWCDGTGPQFYRAIAWCHDGHHADVGIGHWFGDTRGSSASCASFGGLGTQWGYIHCTPGIGLPDFYISFHGGGSGPIRSDVCTTSTGTSWSYSF
jgi:hypothetical protein